MSRFFSTLVVALTVGSMGLAAGKKTEKAEKAPACRGKALAQKDCLLQIGKIKIQVWHDKIIYNDGINSSTSPVPDQTAEVVWRSLETRRLGSRWFIILEFWSGPEKATDIETLNWHVYEVADNSVVIKLQKPVQKRVKSAKGQWRDDKAIPHALVLKGKDIYAQVGREKILVEKILVEKAPVK